jgi:hypothetical protein
LTRNVIDSVPAVPRARTMIEFAPLWALTSVKNPLSNKAASAIAPVARTLMVDRTNLKFPPSFLVSMNSISMISYGC